ncbi:hypothetical protein [Leptotrichia sp. oral taxon 879]|jgi:hypothetical protein|uniref:hypothetical protein n=1 Tax=Leptotrichia sp. oral taxon 879 TaxID=1227267 RepID=UPI0003AE6844|nr:hypothetical protein [Leptotrichia sp. oral taxon 879]ERK48099.1 hypothetical protein HMPREF1552_02190 [Leptotrichia sp. oral taxon 879 str. F0557]
MKKFILLIMLFLLVETISLSNVIPNVWTVGFGSGILNYQIFDKKGQKLEVKCDSNDAKLTEAVFYNNNGKKYTYENFALLVDGNAYYDLKAKEGGWRREVEWDEFVKAISKGKNIEVYINSKSVAKFTPTPESIRDQISSVAECTVY